MSDIGINGKSYGMDIKGDLATKKIQSVDQIKKDLKDDIVIKDKNGQLIDISADEIDIKGSLMKPYVGLPRKDDSVFLFVDGKKVEGTVVQSEDENDLVTLGEKEVKNYKEGLGAPAERQILADKMVNDINKALNIKPEDLGTAKKPEKVLNFVDDLELEKKELEFEKKVNDLLNNAESGKLGNKIEKNINNFVNDVESGKLGNKIEKKLNNFADDVESGKLGNKIEKKLNNFVDDVESGKLGNKIEKTLNNTAKGLSNLADDIKNNQLTLGQIGTYSKGSVDVSFLVGNKFGVSSDYIFNVKKLDEIVEPLGDDMIKGPYSAIPFLAQSAGVTVFENDVSVGYKATLGMEFNRAFEKDFSVGFSVKPSVGIKDSNPYLGLSAGIEARYELKKDVTLFGGFTASNILAGENKGDKFKGVNLGLNFKF